MLRSVDLKSSQRLGSIKRHPLGPHSLLPDWYGDSSGFISVGPRRCAAKEHRFEDDDRQVKHKHGVNPPCRNNAARLRKFPTTLAGGLEPPVGLLSA